MHALKTFKDDFGVVRKNGEEWLIKMSDTETHIPNVYEEVSIADLCVKSDRDGSLIVWLVRYLVSLTEC